MDSFCIFLMNLPLSFSEAQLVMKNTSQCLDIVPTSSRVLRISEVIAESSVREAFQRCPSRQELKVT